MSFLIDPPLLYSGGRTYARITRDMQPSHTRDAKVASAYMVCSGASASACTSTRVGRSRCGRCVARPRAATGCSIRVCSASTGKQRGHARTRSPQLSSPPTHFGCGWESVVAGAQTEVAGLRAAPPSDVGIVPCARA